MLTFLCPHCGVLAHDEDVSEEYGLDCGTTLQCSNCKWVAVVDVRTPKERKREFQNAEALPALRELEVSAYEYAIATAVKLNEQVDELPRLIQALAKARAILYEVSQ